MSTELCRGLSGYEYADFIHRTLPAEIERGSLVIRGSAARGEPRPFDLDLSAWFLEEPPSFDGCPDTIGGVVVNTDSISIGELAKLYETSLRGAPSPFDVVPLEQTPELWRSILELRREFMNRYRFDYPIHLLVEEEVARRTYDHLVSDDYYIRKRQPGSKRSMFRAAWMLKSMDPKLIPVRDFYRLRGMLESEGYLTAQTAEDWERLYYEIDTLDESQWSMLRSNLASWIQETVAPNVVSFSRQNLPAEYVDSVALVIDPNTPQTALIDVYRGLSQFEPHSRQWTLKYGLSTSNLPPDVLLDMWASCVGRRSDESIMRHLIINANFPIDQVDLRDLPNSNKVRRALKTRSLNVVD